MRKLLVLSLVVIFSIAVFAGKLSFSGSLDVTPWVIFHYHPSVPQFSFTNFGKQLDWSLKASASSDYGTFNLTLKGLINPEGISLVKEYGEGDVTYVSETNPEWIYGSLGSAYIETPLVEATDITLKTRAGKFSAGFTAQGGGGIWPPASWGGYNRKFKSLCSGCNDAYEKNVSSWGLGWFACNEYWGKNPTISDKESYEIADMLMLDYKDALSMYVVLAAYEITRFGEDWQWDEAALDIDIYTRFLLLDPVWLYVDIHNLGGWMSMVATGESKSTSSCICDPTLVLMGRLDANKEAGFPLGFAFKVTYDLLQAKLKTWEVGGWFDFEDPLSIYWKLSGSLDLTDLQDKIMEAMASNDVETLLDLAISSGINAVVTVDGIEMLKGDWQLGVDFAFNPIASLFYLEDVGLLGSYAHPKDAEISYYPGILFDCKGLYLDALGASFGIPTSKLEELTGMEEIKVPRVHLWLTMEYTFDISETIEEAIEEAMEEEATPTEE